ncbi:MAG: HEPN domain-containing protein [Deltaproteobacteria bacterium]|nr:MAG: HEPN domain-containing protein [Deltaproteobacteria bacterium]
MTNKTSARMNIERAALILNEAKSHLAGKVWNLAVRRSQEAVEIALKGALRWAAIDVPKVHDVGELMKSLAERFPQDFSIKIERMCEISEKLAGERLVSFYGDEEEEKAPEELYTEDEARKAVSDAEFVLSNCRSLIKQG